MNFKAPLLVVVLALGTPALAFHHHHHSSSHSSSSGSGTSFQGACIRWANVAADGGLESDDAGEESDAGEDLDGGADDAGVTAQVCVEHAGVGCSSSGAGLFPFAALFGLVMLLRRRVRT